MNRDVVRVIREIRHRILPAFDRATRRTLALVDGVTCSKGCASCCYIWVDASAVEGARVADAWLRQQGSNEASAVAALEERLRPPLEHLRNPFISTRTYFGTPCAFLRNQECTVYADRPDHCRTHYVVGDPADCAVSQRVLKYVNMTEAMAAARQCDQEAHDMLGIERVIAPLPVAVIWGLRLLVDGPRGFVTWLQGADDLYRPARWVRIEQRMARQMLRVLRGS